MDYTPKRSKWGGDRLPHNFARSGSTNEGYFLQPIG